MPLSAPTALKADAVRLVNGDIIRGNVISVDQKEVKLQSALLGTLTIARDQVEAIGFGTAVPVMTHLPRTNRPAAGNRQE